MTQSERATTNPLTDERIVVREFISDLAGSTSLDILRSLDEGAKTASTIAESGEITRQTVSKHLVQLTDLGLTKTADAGGYELTAGGKITLEAFESCPDGLDREPLTQLTRSEHTIPLLQTLAEQPSRPSELVDITNGSPSRATVRRALRMFETEGWSVESDGVHRLTPAGQQTVERYEELAETIEQVLDKAPWFQRLNPIRTDIPVRALADAKLYVSSPHSPGIVLATALKLCDPRLDHFRVLTSIFNPTLFSAYNKLLKLGLKGEAIVDASLYQRLHEEEMEYFLDDSNYDNFQIFCLDEPLTLGIGIYDREQIAVGAYNKIGEGEHIAMILSSNEAVVQWGEELYNHYRKRARDPAEM